MFWSTSRPLYAPSKPEPVHCAASNKEAKREKQKGVSAITNLASLSADPARFGLMIALDILVIFAVAAHGSENREY